MAGLSSNEGEFAPSPTTSASASAAANPSPVSVFTPLEGDAATTSWPCSLRLFTTFVPIRPVPPITTIFILLIMCRPWQDRPAQLCKFQLALSRLQLCDLRQFLSHGPVIVVVALHRLGSQPSPFRIQRVRISAFCQESGNDEISNSERDSLT